MKKFILRWLEWILLVLILAAVIFYSFHESIPAFSSPVISDKELSKNETEGLRHFVRITDDLDSVASMAIADFSLVSTEKEIDVYLQDPQSTYPKRFLLSAVIFIGNSTAVNEPESKKQLTNIYWLMKKYPDLVVSLYGHTSDKGSRFNKHRVGRDRARLLRDIMLGIGAPGSRINCSYIEKPAGIHNESWGVDIAIDIFTEDEINIGTVTSVDSRISDN